MYCNKCGSSITDDGIFCPKCGNRIEIPKDDNYVYEYKEQVFFKITYRIYYWIILGIASMICMIFEYVNPNINGYNLSDLSSTYNIDTAKVMIVLLIINNFFVIATGLIGIYMDYILARVLMIIQILLYFVIAFCIYYNFSVTNKITEIGIGCFLNITVAVASLILYFTCRKVDLCLGVKTNS